MRMYGKPDSGSSLYTSSRSTTLLQPGGTSKTIPGSSWLEEWLPAVRGPAQPGRASSHEIGSARPGGGRGQQDVAGDGDDEDRGDRGGELQERVHWKPPKEAPGEPLGLDADPVGDDVDNAVGHRRWSVVHPVSE